MGWRFGDGLRRPWSVVLAVSLGLNLFLAGWAVTELALGPATQLKPVRAPEQIAADIATILPPADADMLKAGVVARHETFEHAHQAYFVALDRLRDSLLAPDFDPETFRRAMMAVRNARQNERTLFGDTMVEAILKMSPEGRRAFVLKHLGGRSADRSTDRR